VARPCVLAALAVTLAAGTAIGASGTLTARAAMTPAVAKATTPAAGHPASGTHPAVAKPANPKSVHPAAASARPAALSAAQRRQVAAAAVRQAIAHATVPDTCSGAISPDTVYPCTTPAGTGTDTFTVTVANATDQLFIRVMPAGSPGSATLPVTVTAPDSGSVTCQQPAQVSICATTVVGTYTVAVTSSGTSYTIAYTDLLAESTCPAASTSFADAPPQGTTVAGVAGTCYSLIMPTGDTLQVNDFSQPDRIGVTVYDATGTEICSTWWSSYTTCTMTGPAPYRVIVSSFSGDSETYAVELNDLSDPQGCAAPVSPLSYGQGPTLTTDPCEQVTIPAAGSYLLNAGSTGSLGATGTLYGPGTSPGGAPSPACGPGQVCTLAAGTYYFVDILDFPPQATWGLTLISQTASAGCAAAQDTDFAAGAATGTFTALGEVACLTLPTAAGTTDYLFNQPGADGLTPQVELIDATGAQLCGNAISYAYATCTLTGTAPFRVLLYGQKTGDGYRYLVQRTDSTAGCTDWPQSGFGGSWGATAALTASNDVACRVIPSGQHSSGEMIDYSNNANTVDAYTYVNDPAGAQACFGNSTGVCSFKAGVTYTALLVLGSGKTDSFHLVRRDVSQTAKCLTPVSTAVGGPSTTIALTSDLDTVCYRVTAKATDDLWFSARTLGPAFPVAGGAASGAVLQVTSNAGAIVCRQWGVACHVSGATSYQLIISADDYQGEAITVHLDAWKAGSASGWAPECARHQFSSTDGFPAVSGTLTEQSTAYCAVVTMQPDQIFVVAGRDSAPGSQQPGLSVYRPADFGPGGQPFGTTCGSGGALPAFGIECSNNNSTTPVQGLLLVNLAGNNGMSPVRYALQGLCWGGTCAHNGNQQANFTAVSPASQPAGPSTFTITGSDLSYATQVKLMSEDGSNTNNAYAAITSVNAAGTSATYTVSTAGWTSGKYDIWSGQAGETIGTPGPGYLPNAYTVTAAPSAPPASTFTAVTPARILDTRAGVGARKAKVAAHGTVTVAIAGHGGVPASRVTAVALDVTAIGPKTSGGIVGYPAGAARPADPDVSFTAGATQTRLIVVPLRSGKLSLYNASAGTVDLTADVTGYYTTASTGSTLTTTGPKRILDTRSGTGARKARVAAHATVVLTVVGKGGVPATGATSVLLDVAALAPTAAGSLTVFPAGKARPAATEVSFAAKVTGDDLVAVPIGSRGQVDLYNGSAGTVDLTAGVVGYYGKGGASFVPFGPIRILDTRSGLGGSGQSVLSHSVAVLDGAASGIYPDALAISSVVLEVTVTGAQRAGTLTVYPDGTSLPSASTFSFPAGQSVTELVVVPAGNVDFWNNSSGAIQVVADLVGYNG
jgi:hypothetical protein